MAFISEKLLPIFIPPQPVCRHVPVENRVLGCTQYELKALFVLSQLFFCSLAFREIDSKHNRMRGGAGQRSAPNQDRYTIPALLHVLRLERSTNIPVDVLLDSLRIQIPLFRRGKLPAIELTLFQFSAVVAG